MFGLPEFPDLVTIFRVIDTAFGIDTKTGTGLDWREGRGKCASASARRQGIAFGFVQGETPMPRSAEK